MTALLDGRPVETLTRTITRRAPGQQPTEEEVLVMADLAAQGGTILPSIVLKCFSECAA